MRRISTAFWYFDTPIEITNTHIDYIISNPKDFSLTTNEIQTLYKKYGERIGAEGKAREELIKRVARQGWIRIRHYVRPRDYWSIQVDSYRKRKRKIQAFCDWAIDNQFMGFTDEVTIVGYDTGEFLNYSFQEGGVSKLYEMWITNKEKIKIVKFKKGITNQ